MLDESAILLTRWSWWVWWVWGEELEATPIVDKDRGNLTGNAMILLKFVQMLTPLGVLIMKIGCPAVIFFFGGFSLLVYVLMYGWLYQVTWYFKISIHQIIRILNMHGYRGETWPLSLIYVNVSNSCCWVGCYR